MVQLELQLLSRPVLLLSQEETKQRLTLQRCDVLKEESITQQDRRKAAQIGEQQPFSRCEYLAGSVRVQDFVLDDEPQPLPLLLVSFGPVQVAAYGGVFSVGGHLEHSRNKKTNLSTPLLQGRKNEHHCAFVTSFSAAGIFFCFLVKEKAPDLMGDTDVEAQRSPEEKRYRTLSDVRGHSGTPSLFPELISKHSTHGRMFVWLLVYSLFSCSLAKQWSHTRAGWFFKYSR